MKVLGYVDDEEATASTLDSDGWLKTGDLCYIDKEGFLFFVDRIKELIKYKGYQVAPAELENLLQFHPDIVEATVVPYVICFYFALHRRFLFVIAFNGMLNNGMINCMFPDEEAGQIPMAFVVKEFGSSYESEIMDFIAKQVAPYKRIRRVMFVDSLPKNATGKLMRKELIKIATPLSKL